MDVRIKKLAKPSKAIKFELREGAKAVGRAYLYIIRNELHKKPYGLLEDLFVDEEYRSKGFGKMLLSQVIAEAKRIKLYKLIGTSRLSRVNVHKFYKKFGFAKYGWEFRMDLKD